MIPLQNSSIPLRFYQAKTTSSSFLIATCICIFVLIGFIAVSDQFLHWFVIPVLVCGILISSDAVDWFRGQLDIFDPVGILGLLGFHFFFLAPLLHVYWDYWMSLVTAPSDWRDWLGTMAFLNILGLIVYRLSRNFWFRDQQKPVYQTIWQLDSQRFLPIVILALVVTAGLQVWVYARFGGIFGYIQAYTERHVSESFQGFGWVFMISESFPILVLMLFVIYGSRNRNYKSWIVITIVLLFFLIVKFLFGGLRGSRSNTVWGLFWAIGMIHFWIRPVSKKFIIIGCIFLVTFLYFYGFYKDSGLDGLAALQSAEARVELTQQTGRGLETALLGDLARSDVQAFLLYRLSTPNNYEYALGRTYAGGLSVLIPRSIWPDRPLTKIKEGTEAQYGRGSFVPGRWQSSRVYGLTGEAMLNFSPVAVPFVFLILGITVGYVRRLMINLNAADIRLLLLPFLINFCFILLASDSDNIVFFLVKNGAVPFLVLMLCSIKAPMTVLSENYNNVSHRLSRTPL